MANYLYNGVELPALPEWDKKKYPYVTIHSKQYWVENSPQYGMVLAADLTITTVPVRSIGSSLWATVDGEAIIYRITTIAGITDEDWVRYENEDFSFVGGAEDESGQVHGTYPYLTWSNYDVLDYTTGEIKLAASYPIDTETGEEVTDYGLYHTPLNPPHPIDPNSLLQGYLVGCRLRAMRGKV